MDGLTFTKFVQSSKLVFEGLEFKRIMGFWLDVGGG